MPRRQPRPAPMTKDEHFAAINAMLPTLRPIQAYCLGFATLLAMQKGYFPPQSGLDLFAECESIAEGLNVYDSLGGGRAI